MPESFSLAPQGFGSIDRRAALVGRAAELRTLEHALRAVEGDRQARTVTFVGAAGIGKTRLVRDFLSKQQRESRPDAPPSLAAPFGPSAAPSARTSARVA